METYDLSDRLQLELLTCMVREPLFAVTFKSALNPRYFERDYYTIVAELILKHVREYSVPPTKDTLQTEVRRHIVNYKVPPPVIQQLQEVVDTIYTAGVPNFHYISDEVAKFGKKQRLREAMILATHELDRPTEQIDFSKIENTMSNAFSVGANYGEPYDFLEVADHIAKLPEFCMSDEYNQRRVSTGFPTIDAGMTVPGLGGGQFGLIMGHTGSCKTTTLTYIGARAAQCQHVVEHVSFESSAEELLLKYASHFTGINQKVIVRDEASYQAAISAFKQAHPYLKIRVSKLPMYAMKFSDVKSYLEFQYTVHGKPRPSLVLYDSPDHMCTPSGSIALEHTDYQQIYSEMIAYHEKINVPFWVTSQANRDTVNTNYGIEGTKGSMAKAELAHIILCIWRDVEEKKTGKGRIHVQKVRRGKSGYTLPVNFDPAHCMVTENREIPIEGTV